MYVAVDMKAMQFLPVGHPDVNVLTNLIWLQVDTEDEIWMFDIYDRNAFSSFTPYQMSKLYCNTVGVDKAPRFGEPLARILLELATRIPNSLDVQAVRLNMQCEKVDEQDSGMYLYDPTGYRPIRKPDLWEKHAPVRVPASENELAIAAAHRLARPLAPKAQPVQGQPASAPAAGATGALAQPWLAKPQPVAAAAPKPAVTQGAVAPGIKKPWEK